MFSKARDRRAAFARPFKRFWRAVIRFGSPKLSIFSARELVEAPIACAKEAAEQSCLACSAQLEAA